MKMVKYQIYRLEAGEAQWDLEGGSGTRKRKEFL